MYSLAIVIGVLCVGGALISDTSVGDVANLAKMQQQMMTLHIGLALLIIGAIRMPKTTAAMRIHEGNSFAEPVARDPEEAAARAAKDKRLTYIMLGVLVVLIAAIYFLA